MSYPCRSSCTVFLFLVLLTPIASTLHAQALPDAPGAAEGSPIPVITGFMSYQTNLSPGTVDLNPEFDPTVLLPIGSKLLIQSEFDMSLDVTHDSGRWGPAYVDKSIEYLQTDYFAHPNLTLVVGRYMIPFGIYRERMHPLWIRDLQAEPISFTLNATSGNGAMLRGAAHLTPSVNVTYAGYYSAASTLKLMEADRQGGFRGSVLLPNRRIEVGVSYNRTMGSGAHSMLGADFTWNLKRIPLDIRSETLFSKEAGNTYWVEGAYRLSKLGTNPLLRNTQLVFRQEQYWMPSTSTSTSTMSGTMGSLPDTNTKRSTAGMTYYLNPNLRLNAAYQGNYATSENSHTWNMGLTYRFAIP